MIPEAIVILHDEQTGTAVYKGGRLVKVGGDAREFSALLFNLGQTHTICGALKPPRLASWPHRLSEVPGWGS